MQNITYVYDELSESVVVNWKKPKQYENCQFTYIIATDDYQTQVSEETFSVAWEKKEINIDISIKRETLGRNPSSGVTITNPFPTVTNIKHEIREDGQVIVTWKKPVTSLEIVNYVLVWNREVHTVKKTSFTTDSFPKCQEIELVIYVQFKDDVSGNATYTFTEAFGGLIETSISIYFLNVSVFTPSFSPIPGYKRSTSVQASRLYPIMGSFIHQPRLLQ